VPEGAAHACLAYIRQRVYDDDNDDGWWLIILLAGEAVNVSSGLGYNGVDEKGRARWNLVDNADILQIEVMPTFVIYFLMIIGLQF